MAGLRAIQWLGGGDRAVFTFLGLWRWFSRWKNRHDVVVIWSDGEQREYVDVKTMRKRGALLVIVTARGDRVAVALPEVREITERVTPRHVFSQRRIVEGV